MDIEDPQIALLKTCRELGVATIAYSPLGRGMLTGRWKTADDIPEGDWRAGLPRFSKENFPKNLELVDDLNSLAKKKDCTVGQLTIAWLMAQGDDIIPIPGTTKQKNFDENMGSLDVKISPEENAKIRQAIAKTEVAGGRYPEPYVNTVVDETEDC
jgi:aryl-alcohol dehydrogenase-like predicted oxidoreductase